MPSAVLVGSACPPDTSILSELWSYWCRAGDSSSTMNWVGTMKTCVHFSRSTVWKKFSPLNFFSSTVVPPEKTVGSMLIQVPLVYSGVAHSDTVQRSISWTGPTPNEYMCRAKWLCSMPFGTPVVPEL